MLQAGQKIDNKAVSQCSEKKSKMQIRSGLNVWMYGRLEADGQRKHHHKIAGKADSMKLSQYAVVRQHSRQYQIHTFLSAFGSSPYAGTGNVLLLACFIKY